MAGKYYKLTYNPNDSTHDPNTDEVIKTIYVNDDYPSDDEYTSDDEEASDEEDAPVVAVVRRAPKTSYSFTVPIKEPYTEEECRIQLHGSVPGSVYPNYLTVQEIALLFPRCTNILFWKTCHVNLIELASLTGLKNLCLQSCSQKDLNGIEYLSSLEFLHLEFDLSKVNLALLAQLPLKNLHLRCPKLQSLSNLEVRGLESLTLACSNLLTLKGLDFSNLKAIGVEISEARILATAELPDGCQILLNEPVGKDTYVDRKWQVRTTRLIRKMYPNCEVILA